MNAIAFRAIVSSALLLYVVYYFLPYSSFESDRAALNLLKLDGYSALHNFSDLFDTALFFLWLVASLGLLHFDNWARHLFLGMTIWSLLAPFFYGIRVTAPIEIALGSVITLLDGAILAIAYFSPTTEMFKRSAGRCR